MVARAGGNQAVASGQEAEGAPEAMAIPGAAEDAHQLDPKNRHPQWEAALGMHPGGRQTPKPGTTQEADGFPQPSMTQEADGPPSPMQPKWWVTFERTNWDSSPETTSSWQTGLNR